MFTRASIITRYVLYGCWISFPPPGQVGGFIARSNDNFANLFFLFLYNSGMETGSFSRTMLGVEDRFEGFVGMGGSILVLWYRWNGVYTMKEEWSDFGT